MCAIDSENPTLIAWLLTRGADVDAKDEFGNTALMEAAANGDAAIVRLLIDGGADIHLTDAAAREKLSVTEMMDEMGLELDEESRANLERADSKFGGTRGETAIVKANSLDVVHLLVAAGAELGNINDEMRAALTGLESEGEINCSPEDYRAGQQRRFGNSNPERINNAFWQAMVRSGATASGARGKFGDDENYGNGPIWCFHRFGKSITQLPDGRIIEVGGEHEDWYDPDFCIYNEVFVHHGGGRFEIFGYPADIFSPTDFHSATLVGEVIYIIGCLGYPEARRSGETPVYRLHCETMEMESVATSGDKPGWVSRHKALHTPDETIHISGGNIFEIVDDEEDYRDNTDEFSLDLSTMMWSRVEDLL